MNVPFSTRFASKVKLLVNPLLIRTRVFAVLAPVGVIVRVRPDVPLRLPLSTTALLAVLANVNVLSCATCSELPMVVALGMVNVPPARVAVPRRGRWHFQRSPCRC